MISDERFRSILKIWAKKLVRPLPWREEKNAYLVWLSEIILQQTRVDQGLSYYLKFKHAYPKIENLAAASEDEVMKLWEGLGYYSRARNMHATAKWITEKYGGTFPSTYKEILALKGVGPYTAAAIASFAFNLPYAVVDGNVYRVLSRIFGIETPIDTTQGKQLFADLANNLLDKDQPGIHNQAMMDFGATTCIPKKPLCKTCPFKADCIAFQDNLVVYLPIKSKKITKKDRFFHYLVFKYQDQTIITKRTGKDIWQNLYEFPLIELDKIAVTPQAINQSPLLNTIAESNYEIIHQSKTFNQTLTHQKIYATFWEINLKCLPENLENNFLLVLQDDLTKFAFPKIIDCYLKDNSITLKLF